MQAFSWSHTYAVNSNSVFPRELELSPHKYNSNMAFHRRRFGHSKQIHTLEENRIIDMQIVNPFLLPRGILH